MQHFSALHPSQIDLSLDRVRALLGKLGNPHKQLPPMVHVAGTNGKGSCIAFLAAIAKAGGLTAHIHTSPHLLRLNERYVLGGSGVMTDAALADVLEAVQSANDGAPATQYEMLTAAMFLAFAQNPADIALIEVGLGGEFDATNVLENPALCLITPIAHDHADYLTDDIANIAAAKAGIIKPGARILSARQSEIPRQILEHTSARMSARIAFAGEDFHAREENGRLLYEDGDQLLDLPLPGLSGTHQIQNAGLAVAAALHFGWDHRAIAAGLEQAIWPGRFERITKGKLANLAAKKNAQIIVDGAHNPHAAKALATTIASRWAKTKNTLVLIVGIQNTKDARRYFESFVSLNPQIICVPVASAPNPMSTAQMQAEGQSVGLAPSIAPDLGAAFEMAFEAGESPMVVVCGSLYLAGEVLALNQQK